MTSPIGTPEFMRADPLYLRAVVERPRATWFQSLLTGLLQLPRLALLLGLGALMVTMGATLVRNLRGWTLVTGLDRTGLSMALWVWGAGVLLVELCALALRDSAGLAWPGTRPTTLSLFLRALLGLTMLGIVCASGLGLLSTAIVELALGLPLFAWSLPAALRGLHTCSWGLRSLVVPAEPSSPGRLATLHGRLGRRIVVGHLEPGEGALTLHGDGEVARLDRSAEEDVLQLDGPPQPLCVIAEAYVGDGGYRGSGVRLDARGLPVWVIAADGVRDRLAGFRARLRLAAVIDAGYVGAVVLGGVFYASYIGLSLLTFM
jgi:hypothetical protein